MNQPVLARQQAQQTEQLTGHAHGGVMIGASAIRDADFEQLLQREAFKPNDMLDDGDTLDKMLRVAEQMATGRCTVPKHLQGSVGDCLAIVTQAMQWDMNPFAVAQKTHVVNGTLGYEAQLVHAVLMKSGAIRSSFHYEYREEGHEVSCRVGAVLRGEKDITWGEWLSSGSVQTKNSPLWKTNKPQQMGYLQVKNWGRKYAPGAILGVYTTDELADFDINGVDLRTGEAPPPPPAAPALPAYADDAFAKNLPLWAKLVGDGKKTAPDLLATLATKAMFSDEQKARILSLKKAAATPPPPPPPADDVPVDDGHDDFRAGMDAATEGGAK